MPNDMGSEACILVQTPAEPKVHLRRSAEAPVEVLTIQEAHALLDQFGECTDNSDNADYWWWSLSDLLEGIR